MQSPQILQRFPIAFRCKSKQLSAHHTSSDPGPNPELIWSHSPLVHHILPTLAFFLFLNHGKAHSHTTRTPLYLKFSFSLSSSDWKSFVFRCLSKKKNQVNGGYINLWTGKLKLKYFKFCYSCLGKTDLCLPPIFYRYFASTFKIESVNAQAWASATSKIKNQGCLLIATQNLEGFNTNFPCRS